VREKTKNEILFILKVVYDLKIDEGFRYNTVKLIFDKDEHEIGCVIKRLCSPLYTLKYRGFNKNYKFIKNAYKQMLTIERIRADKR
jgi:hypothetical protein